MSTPDFSRPHDVDSLTGLLGAGRDVYALMPREQDIPAEFKGWGKTPFNKVQQEWFFRGLPNGWPLDPKPGIDHRKALAHLSAIQRSFEPSHEHKEAAVAYLLSLWYDVPPDGKPKRLPPKVKPEPRRKAKLLERKPEKVVGGKAGKWKPGMPLRGGLGG